MIRLGLIGAGRWGQNYIKTISSLPGVVLAGVASRLRLNWSDLIASGKLDGVIIATPPETHAEMLEAAIRARLPAMVEKPLTLNLGEAVRLRDLQRKFKTPVLVDHTQLFNSAYIELKRQAPQFGPISTIHSEAGNWGPFRNYTALWDYGPHDLALTLDLLEQLPTSVKITAIEERIVEDGLGGNYRIELDFSNTIHADIRVGNLFDTRTRRFAVDFQRHSLILDDLASHNLVLHNHAADTRIPLPVDPKLPLTRAVETFVEGIGGNISSNFGLDLAVEICRVLNHASVR